MLTFAFIVGESCIVVQVFKCKLKLLFNQNLKSTLPKMLLNTR